jgi:hypothetical protein
VEGADPGSRFPPPGYDTGTDAGKYD